MPQINADDPAARDYMIDCARYWLDLGVDGLRLDYANGPSHAFWSAFRAATRATRPDSVTLGEVVETPALQQSYAGRMDGCLDFVLLQGLRDLFAFGTSSPATFDAFVRRHLEFFPQDFVLPSFLDNHDMNRFLWVVQGDTRRLKLAALCQFTLPNPPIIYYGTEVGLSQERDVRYADGSGHAEESRAPMPWGAAQDTDLLAFYQVLVALRRAAPEVWRGERSTLRADHEAGAYVYRCAAGEQAAVVALNSSSAPVAVTLPPERSYWIGLASGAAALQGNKLLLEPLGGAVLWERER
jgi:glycosidase